MFLLTTILGATLVAFVAGSYLTFKKVQPADLTYINFLKSLISKK